MRRFALLIVPLMVVLAGCGEKSGTTDSRPAGKKKIVVGIVSPALTSVFHQTLAKGAREEGAKLGWDVESVAPDRETNFAGQVNMVEALVRRKVDAISVCAINDTAIAGAIQKANAAGIPVFVHNSLTDVPGCKVTAYIGYDQRKAGRLCGDYSAELLKKKHGDYKGKVYVVLGIPGFHSKERSGGFVDAIKKHPGISVVAMTPANWERQEAMNVANAALKATPDIDLFFGCSDAMDQGAAQAAMQGGKKVFTIGIDGNPDTFQDIKKGVVTATCAVFPEEMGRVVIRTIKDHLDGKKVGPKVETPTKIIDRASVGETE